MRVVFRAAAKRDLRKIGDWISRDDPRRADTFVAELEERAGALTDMSRRGPVFAQTRRGPVHKLTHGRYLILYRVLPNRVEIIQVRHSAMDTPRFD